MILLERLEDKRQDWQAECSGPIDEGVRDLGVRLSRLLPDPAGPLTAEQLTTINTEVWDGARAWVEKHLLPRCLDWLRAAKQWPEADAGEHAHPELAAALQHLPRFELPAPEPTLRLPVASTAIAAAVGAALLMLLVAPLAHLAMNSRELGLFAGGILGSAGLVALVSWLAATPKIRKALSTAMTVSTAGTLVGGVWSFWRQSATGWLRGSLGLLGTSFVLFVARPRLEWPSRESYLTHVREPLKLHLRHVADLVLGWCWAHPVRYPDTPETTNSSAAGLPGTVSAALSDLHAQLAGSKETPADLRDSVEELLQRFEDDGYEWKSVEPGTPFDEALKEDFETFGLIETGQPVRTRRAALRRRGELVQKGELRRV
jgi:hypothetical protein